MSIGRRHFVPAGIAKAKRFRPDRGARFAFCRYYTPLSISLGSQTERVTGGLVSGNYFQALGIGPVLGRVFSPEEDDRVYKGHRLSC